MEPSSNGLRVMFIGAVVLGIAALPFSAGAQTERKTSSKKHKAVHSKKAHARVVRHKRKSMSMPMHKPEADVVVHTTPPPIPAEAGPVAGKPYDEAAWRGFHADWNGQYHYSDGKYYYDDEHKYLAAIPSDFNAIANKFGGVGILDNDPTLVFTGDSGEPYPIVQYNADRYNSEKKLKLKSAFFGRAYFWRDGFRYDRKMVVNDQGVRCFQFVKHP